MFFANKTRTFLISVTIILIVFMALSTLPFKSVGVVGRVSGAILTPVQKVVSSIINSTENFFSFFINIKSNERKNENLKEEVSVLNAELREMVNLKIENERLRGLLELKENDDSFDYVAAKVVSRSSDNWYNVISIDKGTKDGLKKNDPVVTNDGLVGHIYEIGGSWAKIRTITDPSSSVAIVSKRTGVSAITQVDIKLLDKGFLKMPYIPKDSNLTEGDLIETSGLGGIYPAGLYVGKVVEVSLAADALTRQAVIEIGAPLSSLTHVLIIKGR